MSKRAIAASLFFAGIIVSVAAQGSTQEAAKAVSPDGLPLAAWRYLSAALSVSVACIGGGIAVGKVGAAAMGAMAEDSSLAGKAIPYLGLAEGICLWGFLVALLILML